MMNSEMLRDVNIPQTLEDALKIAKSLFLWIEWIKANGSMSSNGGWVELHLSALTVWNQQEKIKASAQALSNLFSTEIPTVANGEKKP